MSADAKIRLGARISEDRRLIEIIVVHADDTMSVFGVSPETADELAARLRVFSLEMRNGGSMGTPS